MFSVSFEIFMRKVWGERWGILDDDSDRRRAQLKITYVKQISEAFTTFSFFLMSSFTFRINESLPSTDR